MSRELDVASGARRAPLLIFAVGNPSRGDDALGPAFLERARERLAPRVAAGGVELLTDFQLQVEHSLDLTGRERVFFVDAGVDTPAPFSLCRIRPAPTRSHSTHAMSAEAVLEAHRQAIGVPPESWLLAIRGERFELGEPLSAPARAHLDAAWRFFEESCLRPRDPEGGSALFVPRSGR